MQVPWVECKISRLTGEVKYFLGKTVKIYAAFKKESDEYDS